LRTNRAPDFSKQTAKTTLTKSGDYPYEVYDAAEKGRNLLKPKSLGRSFGSALGRDNSMYNISETSNLDELIKDQDPVNKPRSLVLASLLSQ
jgi:hypothetical protein